MRLSVVVPVRDEADNVAPLVEEIRDALEGRCEYEVVCVDDGSTDGTLDRLKALQRGFPRLRVLRHARGCGQSAAIRTGVAAARGGWIATLDGDGQNDPADIPRLLAVRDAEGGEGARLMVAGWRRRRRDGWQRRVSSRVANAVRARLLRDGTPDTGCGLKLFPRALFLELPYFDHMHRFLPALARRAGARVVSVEVNHRPRTRGRSKYGLHNRLWAGLVDLAGVMWLMRRSRLPEVEEVGPER